MSLNIVKLGSNMYQGWITHTWNTIKGECYHDCSYCYMKRWGKLNPVRFDEKELKTDLGKGNFIFVGSSNDMFAENINDDWIIETLYKCRQYPGNKYFFQSKNPFGMYQFRNSLPKNSVVCATMESDIWYPQIMGNSCIPNERAISMNSLSEWFETYVTIEPILDFNIKPLLSIMKMCNTKQINIGADTGNNNLPEPPKEKILELISELQKFTKVKRKSNLNRLLK